jgi:FkbM family methyltransferase
MMNALVKSLPAEYRFRLQDMRKRWFPNAYHRSMQAHNQQMQQFYRQFLSPGDLVIDVGANLGNRVATFLKLNCKVVAVEPQASCASFLRWKYGNKITLIQKGMSDHDGVEEFHVSESHTISSFASDWVDAVTKSGRFEKNSWQKKAQMQVSTLDKVMRENGTPVFIKIDVEGYEPTVIRGLK